MVDIWQFDICMDGHPCDSANSITLLCTQSRSFGPTVASAMVARLDSIHDAVLAGEDTESGITIHYVDEHYDNGDVILQVSCPVYKSDTSDTLSARIHSLEHTHFAKVVEDVVGKL